MGAYNSTVIVPVVLLVVGLAVFIGWNAQPVEYELAYDAEATSHANVEHPIPEKMPYYDHDHVQIDASTDLRELTDIPDEVAFLSEYLDDPSSVEVVELDNFVHDPYEFHVAAPDEDRLIIADGMATRFFEYDVEQHETTELAQQGEGPEDVHFIRDLEYANGKAYIGMGDQRIAIYNCEVEPCTFEEQISQDVRTRSIAQVDDQHFATVVQSVRGEESTDAPIEIIDLDGEVTKSFGTTYDLDSYRVQRVFLMSSNVVHARHRGETALTYGSLPHIYIYDTDGALSTSFEVDGFVTNTFEYREDRGGIVLEHQERSFIFDLEIIDRRFLLFRKEHRDIVDEDPEGQPEYAFRNDYFLIDLDTATTYHVGTQDDEASFPESVVLTDYGLVVNEAGALSFVSFD